MYAIRSYYEFEYKTLRPWRPEGRWTSVLNSSMHGKYVKSIMYKKSGDGSGKVQFVARITSYNVCYTKLLRVLVIINLANLLWYNSTSVSTEINTKDYSQQVLSYTTNDFVYSSDLLTQNNTNE